MADLLKVMEREMLHSEHAARCVLEARRRDVRKGGKMTKKAPAPSPLGGIATAKSGSACAPCGFPNDRTNQ
jgi:hypothetical protein